MPPDDETKTISTASADTGAVCKVDDDFVRDSMRWVVLLSNGETIFEDDNRQGMDPPSAWKRLKAYCGANGLHVVEMWLQFRSNRVMVEPRDADGYFLVKSVYGFWGDADTHHAYIAGALVDGIVHATKWKVPELTAIEDQVREVDADSDSLIARNG
jgi:hypothetical protein